MTRATVHLPGMRKALPFYLPYLKNKSLCGRKQKHIPKKASVWGLKAARTESAVGTDFNLNTQT